MREESLKPNVLTTYSYDAFGNLDEDILDTDIETDYLYTGQQYDPHTELYSLRARYYDTEIGRFMSRDTWAYDYGNPIELNRYVYTANNPATFVDPSGYGFVQDAGNYLSRLNQSKYVRHFVVPFMEGFFAGVVGYTVGIIGFELFRALWNDEPYQHTWNPIEAWMAGFWGGALGVFNAFVGRLTSNEQFTQVRKIRYVDDAGMSRVRRERYVNHVAQIGAKLFGYGVSAESIAVFQTLANEVLGAVDTQEARREIALAALINELTVIFDQLSEGRSGSIGRIIGIAGTIAGNVIATNLSLLSSSE